MGRRDFGPFSGRNGADPCFFPGIGKGAGNSVFWGGGGLTLLDTEKANHYHPACLLGLKYLKKRLVSHRTGHE